MKGLNRLQGIGGGAVAYRHRRLFSRADAANLDSDEHGTYPGTRSLL